MRHSAFLPALLPVLLAGCIALPLPQSLTQPVPPPPPAAPTGYVRIEEGGGPTGQSGLVIRADDSWSAGKTGAGGVDGTSGDGTFAYGTYERVRMLLERQMPLVQPSGLPCPAGKGTQTVTVDPPIEGRSSVSDCTGGAVAPLIAQVRGALGR